MTLQSKTSHLGCSADLRGSLEARDYGVRQYFKALSGSTGGRHQQASVPEAGNDMGATEGDLKTC